MPQGFRETKTLRLKTLKLLEFGFSYSDVMEMACDEMDAWLASVAEFNTPPDKREGQKVPVRRPKK